MQWPKHEDHSVQFLRVLGSAQDGGSAISECFLTASHIFPGDDESWYREWKEIADINKVRGDLARNLGNYHSAQSNWLRASNYYRAAAIFLAPSDTRRSSMLKGMQACSHNYLEYRSPVGEIVRIQYSGHDWVEGYFVRASNALPRTPVVICICGPDHFKEEHLHKFLRHAHSRKLSLFAVDLPGQGAAWRRTEGIKQREIEMSISSCVDYLIARGDVDEGKVAIFGDGLGASYASRAASVDNRFAAAVCDGGILDLHERAFLMNSISGCVGPESVKDDILKLRRHSIARRIQCPILVALGEHDVFDANHVADLCNFLEKAGLDIYWKIFQATETAASHAHIDNPTLANEFIFDWIALRLGVRL